MICSVTFCFSEFVSIMVFTDLKNISTSMRFFPEVCCHHVANTEQHSLHFENTSTTDVEEDQEKISIMPQYGHLRHTVLA